VSGCKLEHDAVVARAAGDRRPVEIARTVREQTAADPLLFDWKSMEA